MAVVMRNEYDCVGLGNFDGTLSAPPGTPAPAFLLAWLLFFFEDVDEGDVGDVTDDVGEVTDTGDRLALGGDRFAVTAVMPPRVPVAVAEAMAWIEVEGAVVRFEIPVEGADAVADDRDGRDFLDETPLPRGLSLMLPIGLAG